MLLILTPRSIHLLVAQLLFTTSVCMYVHLTFRVQTHLSFENKICLFSVQFLLQIHIFNMPLDIYTLYYFCITVYCSNSIKNVVINMYFLVHYYTLFIYCFKIRCYTFHKMLEDFFVC